MKQFDFAEQLIFSPQAKKLSNNGLNFVIRVEGEDFVQSGRNHTVASPRQSYVHIKDLFEDGRYLKIYENAEKTLKVKVAYELFDGGTVRQTVEVTNIGTEKIFLNHLSSAQIDGIAALGTIPWYKKERLILHTCDTSWQSECQWRHHSLDEYGLVPGSNHFSFKRIEIGSVGSFSTSRYYPLVILEDIETKNAFYLELEPAGSWQISIFNPSVEFCEDGVVGIEANCADLDFGGWELALEPNQSYCSQPCVYGSVKGGFEEAVAQLTAYKRKTSLAGFKDKIPIVYNTYMNGLWQAPDVESLISLIDSCAEIGVDIFCIDDGWFKVCGGDDPHAIGDYVIDEERFKPYGLKGIFDYMLKKGLTPGIWLEMECSQVGISRKLSEKCVCRRNGKIIGDTRGFFDFGDTAVRDYFENLIDELYAMGVRYIKNDYNQTLGLGFSNNGRPYPLEMANSLISFVEFIDRVKAKHKDLIIENCSSGGMREDNFVLRHFELQSTSDQELFYRYPSIIAGSLACMAPEKAGIWAYPYPVLYSEQAIANDKTFIEECRTRFSDGEETVFNMVNGMFGNLYFSGRIDRCDEKNMSLIKEGIELYKSYRGFWQGALPIWPDGIFTIEKEGVFSFGLLNKERKKILLAVWNINSDCRLANINLLKWISKGSSATVVYPNKAQNAECELEKGGILKLELPEAEYSARFIEINI